MTAITTQHSRNTATAPLIVLADHAAIVSDINDNPLVAYPGGQVPFTGMPLSVVNAITSLANTDGYNLDQLATTVAATGQATDVAFLYFMLETLGKRALLQYSLQIDGQKRLSVQPMRYGELFTPARLDANSSYQLSRFAHCRQHEGAFILETPLSGIKISIHQPDLAQILHTLSSPLSVQHTCNHLKNINPRIISDIFAYLLAARAICPINADGIAEEDTHPALRQWEFHDLTFHAHTRSGSHSDPLGAYFPFDGIIPAPPALKPLPEGEVVHLPCPETTPPHQEPGFQTVMEQRHSWRHHDDENPITLEELGTFLFRTARIRALYDISPERGQKYQESNRPYPNGGAMYELELYVTVRLCQGLEAAIYYYDAAAHQLIRVDTSETHRQKLLRQASISAAGAPEPQILFTMTSRFERMSWKYRSMAYATTLKHVGVLMGSMYLVATAMGLAPCALGNGLSELKLDTNALDYFSESPVGDFMLGRKGKQPEDTSPDISKGNTVDQTRTPATKGRKASPSLAKATKSFLEQPVNHPDPGGLYRRLLDEEPIHRTMSGAWLISSYDDTAKLISHPAMSVNHQATVGTRPLAQSPDIAHYLAQMMSMRDPPDHDRIATHIRGAFKPAAINALRPQIDDLINEALQPGLDARRFDIIADLGRDLPVNVTCAMLGIPRTDWPKLQGWTALLTSQIDNFDQSASSLEHVTRDIHAFAEYIHILLSERQARPRPNDVLSDIVAANQVLSWQEMTAQCMLLLIGGRDTVTNMIGNSLLLLIQHPDQLEKLRQNRSLIPNTVEECLRFESPIRLAVRTLKHPLTYRHHAFMPGEVIMFLLAAANRDAAHFAEPDTFMIERPQKPHFAFGRGTHFCIGHQLARVEGASILTWLLKHCRSIEPLDDLATPAWSNCLPFRGLTHLNVRFNAA
ncbi:cytochrome P450 [Thalassospira marina]|uniref:Nitroreductase domain-containing protein n=1 Tax=Thalassospira marina TaxID=2048283 RepID=A0ABN5FMD9_9PROT|nr:cytochrome P450 [Thalassospira marina]AUG55578.1 hypothetical protein CSC3H3_22230 [Thalassospira marina]